MEDLRKVTKAQLIERNAELQAQLDQARPAEPAPAATPADPGTLHVGQLVRVTNPDGTRHTGLIIDTGEGTLVLAPLQAAHPVDLALATVEHLS